MNEEDTIYTKTKNQKPNNSKQIKKKQNQIARTSRTTSGAVPGL